MKISSLMTAALIALVAVPDTAPAQQSTQNQGMAALPPALRAAILSGNTQGIIQAINVLSGGDPLRAANLAAQAIRAGEGLLESNPNAAGAVASAAMSIIRNPQVQNAAPTQTQIVLLTAARISVHPAFQRANPSAAAGITAEIRSVVASNQGLQTGAFATQLAAVLPSTSGNNNSNNNNAGQGQSGSPSSSGSSSSGSGSGSGSGGGGSAR